MEHIAHYPMIFEADDFDVSGYFVARSIPDDWIVIENGHVQAQLSSYLMEPGEDDGITLAGLRKLAKSAGVKKPETISLKIELIRAIQMASYHQPCFRSELSTTCKAEDCNWRFECKK